MNPPFSPLPPVENPALEKIDELARAAAESLRNADRYPQHASVYRGCAETYNLCAGSTASDLGLATMLWDAPDPDCGRPRPQQATKSPSFTQLEVA